MSAELFGYAIPDFIEHYQCEISLYTKNKLIELGVNNESTDLLGDHWWALDDEVKEEILDVFMEASYGFVHVDQNWP